MSKIFKCFVCGLLGIVIGAGATFGAMAAAVYYSYGNVTVSSVIGNNEYNDVLGDLKDFSVDEILGLIQKGQANPENYTFRDLELKYGFDMVALINKFGGGNDKIIADDGSNAKYVEQLKDVSPFTILKGGDGAKKFLDNLPFGAVLSFIPSSAMFAENERVILRRYSVGDMFKKDPITGETGIAGALREVRVGGVFPILFDYDETSDTYKVKEGKYSGLSLVGNLKFGPFIDVATGKKDVTSVLGDASFGDILETFGYKYNGEKWLNKDGKEPKAGILVAMSDVRVSDLLGGKDELDATKLRVKIAKEIMLHCGDMTLGDGFGGLLKVTYDEVKKSYVWAEGSNAGKEVNGALNELLETPINDIAKIFAQEKIDGKQIERVLLSLTDGIKIGYVLGANRADDGSWTSSRGEAIESKYYKFYEITLDKLIAPFFDGAEASAIFDIFIDALGDVPLGEVIGYTKDGEEWKDGATAITDPITKKICNINIGKILTGSVKFDTLLDDVKLGEMMGCTYCDGIDCSLSHAHAEGWYDNGEKVAGITAVMVGLTVAEVKNGTFTQKLNDLTLQDVVGEVKADDPLSLIGGTTKLGEISNKMKDISNATLGKFRQVGIITAKEEQLDDAFGKILKLVANDIAKGDENSPTYEAGHVYQFSEDIRTEAAAYITVDSTTGTVTYKNREFWSNMTFTRMMECMIAASNSLNV